jgi:hypothetical protein
VGPLPRKHPFGGLTSLEIHARIFFQSLKTLNQKGKTVEKNAAPPYEKTSAASAALFQSNLEYILHQRRLAWAQSDVPESSWQLYHALWSEAIDVYFGDLALALRNKPTFGCRALPGASS